MNVDELKKIAEGLIETTELAGIKSIELQKKGLKITTKPDGSPVSNGDLEVNMLLTKKIEKLTPSIPVVSEETVDLKKKILLAPIGLSIQSMEQKNILLEKMIIR